MPLFNDRPVVFVVEDGEGTRELNCLVLESFGFTCRSATTIDDALRLIRSDPRIDIVFSDIHFPGNLTGVDLALVVRQEPLNLPVLLTSGLAIEYVQQILPDGLAFLAKPYTPEQLLAAIRSVIDIKHALPSIPAT